MHALDLGNNGMTETSAASLAAYQDRHPDLRDLNLYMNQIGSAGLNKVPAPTACTTCHRTTDSATCLTSPAGVARDYLRSWKPACPRSRLGKIRGGVEEATLREQLVQCAGHMLVMLVRQCWA